MLIKNGIILNIIILYTYKTNNINTYIKNHNSTNKDELLPIIGSIPAEKIEQINNNTYNDNKIISKSEATKQNHYLEINILIFLLFITLLSASYVKKYILKKVNKEILNYITSFTNDLFIFIFIIAVLKVVYYYNFLLSLEYISKIKQIETLLTIFILLYILIIFILLIWIYFNFKKWKILESNKYNKEGVFRDFEKSYIFLKESKPESDKERLKKNKQIYKNNLMILKYLFLRNEFINNNYTPSIKGDLLRDDFDFSLYLGKCLIKTFYNIMHINHISFITFIVFFVIYFGLQLVFNRNLEYFIFFFISMGSFFVQNVVLKHCNIIYSMLHKKIETPYEFNILEFDALRGNNNYIANIHTPPYLRDYSSNLKATDKSIKNPHESLFLFNNPKYITIITHFIILFQIIWVIIFYFNYFFEIKKYYLHVICLILTIFTATNLLAILPMTIKTLTIVSNIHMLKDDSIIDEVIQHQKQKIIHIFYKLYKILKNEGNTANPNSSEEGALLNEIVISQVRQLFNNIDSNKVYNITLKEIITILYKINKKIPKEDLIIFINKCITKSGQPNNPQLSINFQILMEVFEEYKVESEYNTYEIIHNKLQKINNNNELFSVDCFENYLINSKFFKESEIHIIITEIKYLQSVDNMITVERVSYLIENLITNMPK